MLANPGQLVCKTINLWALVRHQSIDVVQNGLDLFLVSWSGHRIQVDKKVIHVAADIVKLSLCLRNERIRAVRNGCQFPGDLIQTGRFS
jgi:hypothetical protein